MPAENYLFTNKRFHLRLRISGSAEKIAFFHWVLHDLDCDWPFGKPKGAAQGVCRVCGGGVYSNPRFDVKHLKGLAKQIAESTELS